MTPCKLLELQDFLKEALSNNDMTCVAAALVIVNEEVADLQEEDYKNEIDGWLNEILEERRCSKK